MRSGPEINRWSGKPLGIAGRPAIDLETDPVSAGYARTFARPGGNVTGLFLDQQSLAGKWIDLLREAAPGIERPGVHWDPSTGLDQLDVRAVSFADRILNGDKPGEMSIEGPDRFELVINRKTAKAMGLTIPQSLLLRADEVIQ